MLIRPLFRVLVIPLGAAVAFGGGTFLLVGVELTIAGVWPALLISALGVALLVVAALCVVLAATGALPEWVVGDGTDLDDRPVAP